MSTDCTTDNLNDLNADQRLDQMHRRLAPYRAALLEHSIYRKIDGIEQLHHFMQHHVFAVWDFMSLLKVLQQRLCGSAIPWLPPADPQISRLVNEIVLAEESDEDDRGGFASHFDLYHYSMQQSGASTQVIDRFLQLLRSGSSVNSALSQCEAPDCVRKFVGHTFECIEEGNLCAIASAFTFGREDLLPDVFQRLVDELNVEANGDLDPFKFYLARHIELDGDEHGPMAERMIAKLCGDEDLHWQMAEEAAVKSLLARQQLWDGIEQAI